MIKKYSGYMWRKLICICNNAMSLSPVWTPCSMSIRIADFKSEITCLVFEIIQANLFSARIFKEVANIRPSVIWLTLIVRWFNVYLNGIFKSDNPRVMCTMWMMISSLILCSCIKTCVQSYIRQGICCICVDKTEEILLSCNHSCRFRQ